MRASRFKILFRYDEHLCVTVSPCSILGRVSDSVVLASPGVWGQVVVRSSSFSFLRRSSVSIRSECMYTRNRSHFDSSFIVYFEMESPNSSLRDSCVQLCAVSGNPGTGGRGLLRAVALSLPETSGTD